MVEKKLPVLWKIIAQIYTNTRIFRFVRRVSAEDKYFSFCNLIVLNRNQKFYRRTEFEGNF